MPEDTAPVTLDELVRERHAIVTRKDSDWTRYGIGNDEKEKWIAAGIPADQAPLAAVALSVGNDGARVLTPAWLDLDLGRGDTPLSMLLAGYNGAEIETRMAAAVGMPMNDGQGAWLRVLVPPRNVGQMNVGDGRRLARTDAFPSRVPDVQAGLGRWSVNDAARQTMLTFLLVFANAVAFEGENPREYRDDPGAQLFRIIAAAHGISLDDDENLRRLALAFPREPDVERAVAACIPMFNDSVDRYYFHSNGEHHRALVAASELFPAPVVFDPSRLPGEAGFGWLAGDGDLPSRILAWGPTQVGSFAAVLVDAEPLIAAAMLSDARTGSSYRVIVDPLERDPADPLTPRDRDEAEVLAVLIAFAEVMERRAWSDPAAELEALPTKERKRSRRDNARSTPRPVALMYARGAGGSSPGGEERRREYLYRWPVRGFWRRQWYPSLQEHRLIWIEEHTAGPADAPLRDAPTRVDVLRPDRERG
ncbi:MAG: hypothetical protein JSR28_11650 [Proteobacteria bacterium]|nr:hypothetical protein [Pseudomonadota bacterium]